MMKILKSLLASIALLFGIANGVAAAPTPYATPGTENASTYTFTAAGTGDVLAYFYGSSAGYTSTLSLLVNGVDAGVTGLDNQASPYGALLNFGSYNAGDALVFRLNVLSSASTWYSDVALNTDGFNHVYATAFDGDLPTIPVGLFIGFEDMGGGGDFDYNDIQFVFVNVANDVPEPASLFLLGGGLLAMAARRRRVGK